MAPWTFSIKLPRGTQFIFESLMFAADEDENLRLLTQGAAPKHPAPVYGKAPYYLTDPSTSGGGLLMFESSCRAILPHRHDVTRDPDQDDHLSSIGCDIVLIFIRSIS
jgi:hypothetical protein